MVLVGVVAATGKGGAALIAVDGKPPKPVAVGGHVGDEWVLASVAPRRAVLRSAPAGSGGEELVLEMPVTPSLLPKSPPNP
jgi:general secretion pathway protein C